MGLAQKWFTLYISQTGLEATFGNALQNRKLQMPSSEKNHKATRQHERGQESPPPPLGDSIFQNFL